MDKSLLRPSAASRLPSHTPSHHSLTQQWAVQYQLEAQQEHNRQNDAATAVHNLIKNDTPVSRLDDWLGVDTHQQHAEVRDHKGRTPMHTAAKLGRTAHLEFLLARKDVDLDALDHQKETPLHLAARFDREDCVDRLLRAGANTEIADARGHLARYYARSHGVRSLFDSPPRAQPPPGGHGKKHKTTSGVPENRVADDPEVVVAVVRTTPAPQPQGMQEMLARKCHGSFWEPSGDSKWVSRPVWHLVYHENYYAERMRAARKKWFHLSATSEGWAKDLARNICYVNGYSSDRARAMRRFMERVFRRVDAEGPVRKHHFVREAESEKKLGEDEMYAVVLPIIDVDKRDYVQLARQFRSSVLNQPREAVAATVAALDPVDMDGHAPVLDLDDHLASMMHLTSFLDQPLPRSLDQSYHEHLDDVKVGLLDDDQVMTRYISRLKAKSFDVMKKPSEKRFGLFGMKSSDSIAAPPPASSPPQAQDEAADEQSDSPPPAADPDKASETQGQEEPNDLITVPHFWLFKIDAGTIITLYSERWDKTNEARLHDHILNRVSNNRDMHDDDSINALAETILRSCLSFEAKAFAKCVNPVNPNDSHDVEVTISMAYSNSVAEIYTDVTERFESLKKGLGSLSKDPTEFYRDVKDETKILIRTDDNIGEIRMIKRILLNQAATFDIFRRAVHVHHDGLGVADMEHREANVEVFQQLETEAERVRAMTVTLLDLRQREAAIEDTLSQGEQSTMLFIFTTVTVLFSPLSLVCSVLAIPIVGYPDAWNAASLAEVFGLATLGTAGLCILMWAVFKGYQTWEGWQRNKAREPRAAAAAPIVLRPGVGAGGGGAVEAAWRVAGWKPRGGLRLRRSRMRGFEEAVGDGKVAGGTRSGDVEKGVR